MARRERRAKGFVTGDERNGKALVRVAARGPQLVAEAAGLVGIAARRPGTTVWNEHQSQSRPGSGPKRRGRWPAGCVCQTAPTFCSMKRVDWSDGVQ